MKNLFVVDWREAKDDEVATLFEGKDFAHNQWNFYNCQKKSYIGWGVANRYLSYFIAVLHILANKRKYDNIIIWQPMIGFMLSLFPRWNKHTKIIISTVLYSPSRVSPGSIRLFLLKQGLKKSDAVIYYSEDMARDAKSYYPEFAHKIFFTYLPITNENSKELPLVAVQENTIKKYQVYTGGLSDRDFETVIKAFSNKDIPVVIVCSKTQVFKNPELITRNITIIKGVSEKEYYSLVVSSFCVVIALEYESSSCGQLLFTFCMNNKIPIIASNCFGTRDYITDNENGILVPIKDSEAIFKAYNRLVTEDIFREKLLSNSKAISESMTFQNYFKEVDKIINQIRLPINKLN